MNPFGLALVLALSASPAKQQDREALKVALQGVIERSPLKNARTSIMVKSLDDGQVIFARHENELVNPASNVKLFTAAAALARLGTEYRFETEFLTDGEMKEGKPKVLYVRGKGDPSLNTERLYNIVSELQHAGLKEVAGDLVVDDSWFDVEREAPGYDQEHGDKAYLAPTGALSLNFNAVGVYLRPAENVGQPAAVEIEPPSDYFTLEGTVLTGNKNQRRYTVTTELEKDRTHQKLKVEGYVPQEKGAWSAWKKVERPDLFVGFTLRELLKQRGIKVKGRVRTGVTPYNAKGLYTAQSDTLDVVLKRLQKNSQNFVAEQLIKTLGAEIKGAPGSHAKGIEVVEEFLAREVGLAKGSYIMRNGSGLNDTNRFSAAQVCKLLEAMYVNNPFAPEYMSALTIAGKDGTLKYRFEGSDAVGRLRGKTGTLENVSALSGYVLSVDGERFVFAALASDFAGRASTVVPHLDALGAAVASLGSKAGPNLAAQSLTTAPRVVGPMEELKAKVSTYAALGKTGERKNAAFLRTAYRTEGDPAVRAVIAEALYQSDVREYPSARLFLDAVSSGEEVFGRLLKASRELKLDTPMLGSLTELGSGGSVEADQKLFELGKMMKGDEAAFDQIADAIATCANEAPLEFLIAYRATPPEDRELVLDVVARGMVRAARPEAPFWDELKRQQGALDATTVELARNVEVGLSQRIAEARQPQQTPQTLPGG